MAGFLGSCLAWPLAPAAVAPLSAAASSVKLPWASVAQLSVTVATTQWLSLHPGGPTTEQDKAESLDGFQVTQLLGFEKS